MEKRLKRDRQLLCSVVTNRFTHTLQNAVWKDGKHLLLRKQKMFNKETQAKIDDRVAVIITSLNGVDNFLHKKIILMKVLEIVNRQVKDMEKEEINGNKNK